MDNSRSRSPRRKHRSRKSKSRSKSRREHKRSGSREDKYKHKKNERVYESPFVVTDLFYSSNLAGSALTKIIKKEFPKMSDIDEIRASKKKTTGLEEGSFIDPQVEESCRKILSRLELQRNL